MAQTAQVAAGRDANEREALRDSLFEQVRIEREVDAVQLLRAQPFHAERRAHHHRYTNPVRETAQHVIETTHQQ